MTDYTVGPHITTFWVRPISEKENNALTSGRRAWKDDAGFVLVKLDDQVVPPGEMIVITVRKDRGVPRLVYIEGGHPLYETWVKNIENGEIVGHFPGLLVEKDWKYKNS